MANTYKQVKVTLDIDDHVKLQNYCREQGVSMAAFFRSSVSLTIDDIRHPIIKKEHKTTDPKLLYQLNRIGINLNQITRYTNENRAIDFKVLSQLLSIEKRLKKLLK